ncbi:MAG: hypothetical protein WEE89_22775 [Gemmatimonadota bacterium]
MQRLGAGLHQDLERDGTHRFMDETADGREIGAAQDSVQVRERLTILEQANGALKNAKLEGAAEPYSAMVIGTQPRHQFDLAERTEAGDRSEINIILARKRCQAAHQLFARIERNDVALRAFAYLHGRAR